MRRIRVEFFKNGSTGIMLRRVNVKQSLRYDSMDIYGEMEALHRGTSIYEPRVCVALLDNRGQICYTQSGSHEGRKFWEAGFSVFHIHLDCINSILDRGYIDGALLFVTFDDAPAPQTGNPGGYNSYR